MGALLALPEILAAWAVAGGEALEISGGLGALLGGQGLEAFEALGAAAAAAGLELEYTPEALYLLGAVPAAVQDAAFIQTGLSTASLLGTGVYYSYQTGHPVQQTHGHSGRVGPDAMALQLWLPQLPADLGIERIPEWLYNAARDAPEILAGIIRDLARGLWRSYYFTGRAIIQRTAGEQLQAALQYLRRQLYRELRPLLDRVNQDPVGQIVDVLQAVRDFGREREQAQIAAGQPIFDFWANREATIWDTNNLPVQGYNDQGSGYHDGGRWINMPGAGPSGDYRVPQWLLYVLEEMEKEVSYLTRPRHVLQKEGKSKWSGKAAHSSQTRRR